MNNPKIAGIGIWVWIFSLCLSIAILVYELSKKLIDPSEVLHQSACRSDPVLNPIMTWYTGLLRCKPIAGLAQVPGRGQKT
jgi:hypothetical protein